MTHPDDPNDSPENGETPAAEDLGPGLGLDEPPQPPSAVASPAQPEYRVLARKYRPQTFEQLIGQQALVRTLANAFASGRIAHAFIMTGVRGVGKTTTARIIARALNCVGPDGTGGPTIQPCGVCSNCVAIAESRHVDVLEMDAASRTGIDDVREIIEGVRYLPVQARYKVYIIDEVHMLSKAAFNGLLKTLEEPPPHAKFIFATTEIRKVPVTVLSRCQRFDLRRISSADLIGQLKFVCAEEHVEVADEALGLIAKAAEGSMRDALSLLDQAIAHGAGGADVELVRNMLGLADRTVIFDLFEAALGGKPAEALEILANLHNAGAEPLVVIADLMDATHWISRMKIAPKAADDPTVAESDRTRGADLAGRLSIPVLARAWQMLLKAHDEVSRAPQPFAAAEMALIRLCHAADLPPPGELVKKLSEGGGMPNGASAGPVARPNGAPSSGPAAQAVGGEGAPRAALSAIQGGAAARPAVEAEQDPAQAEPQKQTETAGQPDVRLDTFEAVATFVGDRGDVRMQALLETSVHLVSFRPGHIELRLSNPDSRQQQGLAGELQKRLQQWTGARWVVSLVTEGGDPTLREQRLGERAALEAELAEHPTVKAVLTAFPGAKIREIRDMALYDDMLDDDGYIPAPPEDDDEEELL